MSAGLFESSFEVKYFNIGRALCPVDDSSGYASPSRLLLSASQFDVAGVAIDPRWLLPRQGDEADLRGSAFLSRACERGAPVTVEYRNQDLACQVHPAANAILTRQ